MTYLEATTIAKELLRGDNTTPSITPLLLREAIHEVARRCEPRHLITTSDSSVFREIPCLENEDGSITRRYLRKAQAAADDAAQVDIDEELCMAVVHFACSMVSNKFKQDHVERAQLIIRMYATNQQDIVAIA